MRYELIYSKNFERFLHKHKDLVLKIKQSFDIIALDPYNNTLNIKKTSRQRKSL